MLKFIPDESPCDLAAICMKKCYEVRRSNEYHIAAFFLCYIQQVFVYRCRLLPDEKIQAESYDDVELPFIPPRFGVFMPITVYSMR